MHYAKRPPAPRKGRKHVSGVKPPSGARRRIATAYRSPLTPPKVVQPAG